MDETDFLETIMQWDEETIQRYLDEDLDPGTRAQVEVLFSKDPAAKARLLAGRALRADLRRGAPKVPSQRMWLTVQRRLVLEGAQAPRLSFWTRVSGWMVLPQVRVGFAMAMTLMVVSVWQPWTHEGSVATNASEVESAPSALTHDEALAPREAQPQAVRRPQAQVAKASVAPREEGPSEVERELASQDLDAMIAGALARRRQSPSAAARREDSYASASAPSAARTSAVAFDKSAQAGAFARSSDDDAYEGSAPVASRAPQTRAQGSLDSNGFWDWRPAALAMNRRDWQNVRAQLLGAVSRAPEASERSFADSALTLLAAPGAPLDGALDLDQTAPLRVQRAGRWQLSVENRVARFAGGVSTRMEGMLAEGDALDLDLTFDRGDFAPGTQFTRLAGTTMLARDAQGAVLRQNQFVAPRGASVNLSNGELRLR